MEWTRRCGLGGEVCGESAGTSWSSTSIDRHIALCERARVRHIRLRELTISCTNRISNVPETGSNKQQACLARIGRRPLECCRSSTQLSLHLTMFQH